MRFKKEGCVIKVDILLEPSVHLLDEDGKRLPQNVQLTCLEVEIKDGMYFFYFADRVRLFPVNRTTLVDIYDVKRKG